jgi:hypothetical protein
VTQIDDTAATPLFPSLILVSSTPAPMSVRISDSGTAFLASLRVRRVFWNFSIASSSIALGHPILLDIGTEAITFFIHSRTVGMGSVYLLQIFPMTVNFSVSHVNDKLF